MHDRNSDFRKDVEGLGHGDVMTSHTGLFIFLLVSIISNVQGLEDKCSETYFSMCLSVTCSRESVFNILYSKLIVGDSGLS